jgi:hypothetical protein
MPVEHLWAWLREDVTYHTCYETQEQLINQVELFQQRINKNPTDIADRLWTKTELNSNEEKLRFSTYDGVYYHNLSQKFDDYLYKSRQINFMLKTIQNS